MVLERVKQIAPFALGNDKTAMHPHSGSVRLSRSWTETETEGDGNPTRVTSLEGVWHPAAGMAELGSSLPLLTVTDRWSPWLMARYIKRQRHGIALVDLGVVRRGES